MKSRQYSRLTTIESKSNKAKALKFFVLTIVLLVLLVTFGLPAIAKFAAFLSDMNTPSTPISKEDKTPPAPPSLNSLPEATNQKELEISGQTESGAIIKLTINGEEQNDVVADSDGHFSLKYNLMKGDNKIVAKAKDAAGNESQSSKEVNVNFDDQAPSLEITTPEDGASYYGARQRQLTITGTTDPESEIVINDRIVVVDDNGEFSFTTTLNEGSTPFQIKAKDKAGNETEQSLTVNFSS